MHTVSAWGLGKIVWGLLFWFCISHLGMTRNMQEYAAAVLSTTHLGVSQVTWIASSMAARWSSHRLVLIPKQTSKQSPMRSALLSMEHPPCSLTCWTWPGKWSLTCPLFTQGSWQELLVQRSCVGKLNILYFLLIDLWFYYKWCCQWVEHEGLCCGLWDDRN